MEKSKLIGREKVLIEGNWLPLLNIDALQNRITVQFGLVVYSVPKKMVKGWRFDIEEI